MYICICNAKTEQDIRESMRLGQHTGAGEVCCKYQIDEIRRQEMSCTTCKYQIDIKSTKKISPSDIGLPNGQLEQINVYTTETGWRIMYTLFHNGYIDTIKAEHRYHGVVAGQISTKLVADSRECYEQFKNDLDI